jgi:vomeronasal 2 receptor
MDHCVKCPGYQYANREQKYCLQKAVAFLACEDSLMALPVWLFASLHL